MIVDLYSWGERFWMHEVVVPGDGRSRWMEEVSGEEGCGVESGGP